MKKKRKKLKQKKKIIKRVYKIKSSKKFKKKTKKVPKIKRKKNKKLRPKILKKKTNFITKKVKKESLALKLVKFQLSIKPQFNFKINFNLEKYIQSFFDKISEIISDYKILKIDEKRRIKIEKIENERKEKIR